MTAVVGIIAFGLTAYVGLIDRPGEPPDQIGLGIGWYLSFLGTILIAAGGATRASTSGDHASHQESSDHATSQTSLMQPRARAGARHGGGRAGRRALRRPR